MEKVIAVLGGGLIKDKDGRWRTTNFDEAGDEFGTLGDRLRVEAAACLYERYPGSLFVASGGQGQYADQADVPTVASVIKRELIELGVPEQQIILEENSGSSWRQLLEIKKMMPRKTGRRSK